MKRRKLSVIAFDDLGFESCFHDLSVTRVFFYQKKCRFPLNFYHGNFYAKFVNATKGNRT